jgi:monoamine oxidase
MTSEERDRAALIRAAAQSWGEEAAATLSELLPPSGDRPATKRDIDGVLSALDAMDQRYDARLETMETRADRRLDERLDATADRITAAFERRIADAVTMQTRTLVVSQLGSVVVIAALAFGLR